MTLRLAERWFERRSLDDGITLLWEPHVIPLMRCNIWHVRGRDRDLMVDTGMGVVSLRDATKDLIDKPVTAAATHSHADHVGGHHEFEDCLIHRLEAANLAKPNQDGSLYTSAFAPSVLRYLNAAGYEVPADAPLITALPHWGYDPGAYELKGATATRIVDEGDVVDLGDRRFEVLHLPGHSPGSIGLWEAESGILFSGDCVYDGPLLDGFSHSSITDYVASMKRLRDLPVRVVHAGHDPSFGRARLVSLIDDYLAKQEP